MNDKQINEEIQKLIDAGALDVHSIDEKTGEFVFRFTDKMKEVNEDLYKAHQQDIYNDVMYFWEKGFLEIEDFFTDNPVILLSNKCLDSAAIMTLPKDRQDQLRSIIEAVYKN